MRCALALALALAGCNSGRPLGPANDAGLVVGDRDLAVAGGGTPDAAVPSDLATRPHAVDLARAPDLAGPRDLALPPDLASPPDLAPPPPTWNGDAVAYQIDPMHRGAQQGTLAPPLTKRWTVDLGASVSYPLIAGGRVFVTVRNAGSSYGARLIALDAATGATAWGPVDLGGTYFWANAAYDAGRVYTVNFDGLLSAWDANTGTQLWSRKLDGQYAFSSPPTAAGGRVFVGGAGSGGTLYAVDGKTGGVLWTATVENGDDSSPVVSDDAVYVSYACVQAYAFAPSTGAPLWHHSGTCEGGGGRTAVLAGGLLYARDWATANAVLDGKTGGEVRGFTAGPIPAFDDERGFFLAGATLQAEDAQGKILWSFTGDGALVSAPIVVNQRVYVGSSQGTLFALDPATGAQLWSDAVGAAIAAPDEQNVSQPLTGLAAVSDLMVVPASTKLVAYANP
jgi:outer membrane protein assembly factor BamB